MYPKKVKALTAIAALAVIVLCSCTGSSNNTTGAYPIIDNNKLATQYFQEDSQWYINNIPFFECSDKQIQDVYYYRWKMFKAHIRSVGDNAYVITEFITHMPWDREPFCTINAASMLQIYEGRWLKDSRYIDGYIDNLYQNGGNNRQYSEGIADAAYANYLVNADSTFITSQLDSMKNKFDGWYDHWDSAKNMYYIPAMPDATEYTIASIDASNGKAGFDSGQAFRPTINSYMYGNAVAIADIAAMKGDTATVRLYRQRASDIRERVMRNLWNAKLQHFTDRFKQSNQYVHYWDFIRGRELAGMIPWFYNLPVDSATYSTAWKHVADTSYLLGPHGLRTEEPSYEYYFKQYTWSFGQRGSQWNGPSWPYQSSQVITGMANLLNNYHQSTVGNADYVKLLRLFTRQHILPDGRINLVENYDPNEGGPLVYYYWSNHYNHSSYNNMVITGLCGIRPSAGDTLVVNPLVDSTIKYFCLSDVLYHGHKLTVVYDEDGSRYNLGKGVTVFVDGKKTGLLQKDGKTAVVVGAPIITHPSKQPVNYALNVWRKGYPMPSASINAKDSSLYQAIDGRIWYFPEVYNRWTSFSSQALTDWYAVDFGQPHDISTVKLYLMADGILFGPPNAFTIDYYNGTQWLPITVTEQKPAKPVANTVNTVSFNKVNASRIRINFTHTTRATAVSEVECY